MDSQDTRDAAAEVARHRSTLLRRTAELLEGNGAIPVAEQYDALPQVTGLLGAALNELKVAEVELEQRKHEFVDMRAELESKARHYRQLFEYAPGALIVTDLYGSISEVNRASTTLLKRTAEQLAQKAMSSFVERGERVAFRERLARLSLTESVHDWRFVLRRISDVAIEVSAAIQFVPRIGAAGSGALHWLIRPIGSAPV